MPQLDPTYFAAQIVWLAIVFTILYLVLSRMVLPRLTAVLEDRQERIDNDLLKAERLRDEAQQVLDASDQALRDARGEANAVLAQANEAMAAEAAQRTADVQAASDRLLAEAEARIAAAQNDAVAHIREIAVAVTSDVVARLAPTPPDPAMIEQAVDQHLAEREAQ